MDAQTLAALAEAAAARLRITAELAMQHRRELPEKDAVYFYNPARGGLQLIVDNKGEMLIATSAITFDRLYKDFCLGRRNGERAMEGSRQEESAKVQPEAAPVRDTEQEEVRPVHPEPSPKQEETGSGQQAEAAQPKQEEAGSGQQAEAAQPKQEEAGSGQQAEATQPKQPEAQPGREEPDPSGQEKAEQPEGKTPEQQSGKQDPRIDQILTALTHLQETFDTKIAVDKVQNQRFDNMHRELTKYQNGALDKLISSMANDIILTLDDMKKIIDQYSGMEASAEVCGKLLKQFTWIFEELQDVLYRQDIEAYTVPGDDVDVRRQKIVGTVPTDDESKNNKVAQRVADGYEKDGKTFRPERIRVYKYAEKK